jgi:hypothetical protein
MVAEIMKEFDFSNSRGYGWGIHFHVRPFRFRIVLDGHSFGIGRGFTNQRWYADYWPNAWRKTGTTIGEVMQ